MIKLAHRISAWGCIIPVVYCCTVELTCTYVYMYVLYIGMQRLCTVRVIYPDDPSLVPRLSTIDVNYGRSWYEVN